MKNTYTTSYTGMNAWKGVIVTLAVAFVTAIAVMAMPTKSYAISFEQFLDPLCLIACDDPILPRPPLPPLPTIHNTSSYSTDSNTNSNASGPTIYNSNVVNNNTPASTVVTTPTPVVVATTPVYNYSYPSYNYTSPLSVNCYATPTSISVGQRAYWRTSISGGNGSYYVTWQDNDGLSGSGSAIDKVYYSSGSKTATVTVTSGNQTISQNCDTVVNVSGNNYYNYNYNGNYNYDNNYYYNDNYYNNGYYNNYYSTLTVNCSVNTSYATTGQNVVWSASASGGSGSYTYRWSGSEGIIGNGQAISVVYSGLGQKRATVTVYSGSQSISRDCFNTVTINPPINQFYNGYNYNSNIGGQLEIACFADTESTRFGIPVTWGVEVTGGDGNYTYAWSGSDGLSGTQRSVTTAYSTPGQKNATVTVTSAGTSASKLCGNVVTVRPTAVTPAPNLNSGSNVNQDNTNNDGISAASLFSLKNVPWGWVAILVILVLFAMVMYLLFNRHDLK